MKITNIFFKLPLIFFSIIIISSFAYADEIGNNYDQQMPLENVNLPSARIETHTEITPSETIDITAYATVDEANGGEAFYYWYADKGTFEIHPSYPDYSTVKYTAPDTSCTVVVSLRVGDKLGYVAKDNFTITVGDGGPTSPTPPANPECTYTATPSSWQQQYHTEYLLTAERTANYKPTGHFRVQPEFDDQRWDYSGHVQIYIDGSAVTLYEDPNLQTPHGRSYGYNQGGEGFEFWFDADFSSHKTVTLHQSEDSQFEGWEIPWMMKADCPTEPPVEGDPNFRIDEGCYEAKPSYTQAGEEVQLRVRVRNIGDGTSSPCKIGYYLANQGDFTKLHEEFIGSLNPDMTAIREPFITLPSDLSDGSYEILFRVNDGNDAEESNTNDNERYAPLIIGTGVSEADLIVYSYSGIPDEAVPGESITFSADVKNIGGSGTSAASRLGYFISEDRNYDSSDIQLGSNYFGFLLPGAETETFRRTFTLPGSLETGQTYYLLIYADYEDKVVEEDESPNNNIAAKAIQVTYSEEMTIFQPIGTSTWGRDRPYDITWTSNLGGTVKIELYKSLSVVKTIAEAAPNNNSYMWTVPSDLQVLADDQKQYKIKITCNADPSISDESEDFRIVYSDELTVLAPGTGEEWGTGTSRNIRWEGTFNGRVEIQLYKNGQYFITADNAESVSTRECRYNWLVPTDFPEGSGYQIRIVSVNDEHAADISPEFSISNLPPEETPITVQDAETTEIDTPVTLSVLLNDNPPTGETLYVDEITQPQSGTAAINAGGQTVTYTPNPGFSGTDTFTYTCKTFKDGDSTATVSVAVIDTVGHSWLKKVESGGSVTTTDRLGNIIKGGVSIQKYDPSGEFQWSADIENGSGPVATDNDGNVYMVGSWLSGSPLVFHEGATPVSTVEASNTGGELFIAKYDADGSFVFAQVSHGRYDDSGGAIAVDGNTGCFYISGQFDEEITLGSGANASTLTADGVEFFLAKFSLNGTLKWVKQISGKSGRINAITVDASGDILTTGYFNETAVFPGETPITLTGNANDDAVFVAKFDAGGNVKWAQKAVDISKGMGMDICTDASGSVYVSGIFNRGLTFFNGNVASVTLEENPQINQDIFFAKYSSNGGILWAKAIKSEKDDFSGAVGIDKNDNPLISGSIGSSAVFGKDESGKTVSRQCGSAFLASYTPDGKVISVVEGPYHNMHVDQFGRIYIGGTISQELRIVTSDGVFEASPGNFLAMLIGPESQDRDGDCVTDDIDAFPEDPTEHEDTDGDGVGNNADTDDDDDGMPDEFEVSNGFDPLDASDASEDPDADGHTNLEEYQLKTDPHKENPVLPSQWIWGRQAEGTDSEEGYALATSPNGNIYVVGKIRKETTFGDITHTPTGSGIFIAGYNTEGECQWVNSAELGGNSAAYGITTDNTGDIYISGYFQYSAYFGDTALTSIDWTMDIFVAKYSGVDGSLQWVQQAGGNEADYVRSITSDGTDVYITGRFYGVTQLGSISLTSKGSSDIFVAKFAGSNGNCLWAKSAGGSDSDYGRCIEADQSGNLYVVGNFKGNPVFGTTALASSGNADIFLAKYSSSSGSVQWVKKAGGAETDYGYSVTTDISGNVYLAGRFASSGLVTKYNSAGSLVWTKELSASDYSYAFAVSNAGDKICVRGYFTGNITLGSETITSQDPGNNYIAVYNTDGEFQWEDHTVNASSSYYAPQSITSDASGNMYATGTFNQNITLGKDTLYPTGGSSYDFFIGKLGNEPVPPISGFTITPTIHEISDQAGTITLQVEKVGSGPAAWTATTDAAPWYSIQNGASGTDDGTITIAYENNPDELRKGVVTVSSTTSDQSVMVEIRQAATTDSDKDGVPDDEDDFPDDPTEWEDTDSDGIGNNADTDDDNDGMSDVFESQYGLNPLNPNDANADADNDGFTNLEEFQSQTDPTDPDSKPGQQISLNAGWNMISLNVYPEDMAPAQVFASISDHLVEVKCGQLSYAPGIPEALNTLKEIKDGTACWVNVEQAVELAITGLPVDVSTLSIALQAGWNPLAYPCQAEETVETALASIMDELNEIKDISTGSTYDPSVLPVFNTLSTLQPGSSYYINLKNDVFLTYPDN